MIETTTESINDFLKQHKFDTSIQKETGQIVVILKVSKQEFPLFLRPFDGSGLLQLLVFLPVQVKDHVKNDLARLIHLVNKELDIPGFGMDEDSDTCFYRVMLPTVDEKIHSKILESYLKSLKLICEQIAPIIMAVANEKTTFQEVLEEAKRGS